MGRVNGPPRGVARQEVLVVKVKKEKLQRTWRSEQDDARSTKDVDIGCSEDNLHERSGNQEYVYCIYFMPTTTSLTYNTQLLILTFLQSTLENCCQNFGERWLPQLMETRRWTEQGSIELHVWVRVVSEHWNEIPDHAINQAAEKDWSTILRAAVDIRHSAVHRHPKSARLILDFLRFAKEFTASTTCIKTIKDQMSSVVDDLEVKQILLQGTLMERFQEIAEKQTLLERKAVDKENTSAAAQNITDIFTATSFGSLFKLYCKNDDDSYSDDPEIEDILMIAERDLLQLH